MLFFFFNVIVSIFMSCIIHFHICLSSVCIRYFMKAYFYMTIYFFIKKKKTCFFDKGIFLFVLLKTITGQPFAQKSPCELYFFDCFFHVNSLCILTSSLLRGH